MEDNNKKTVYHYKFKNYIYVFAGIVSLILVAFIVIDILKLIGVGYLISIFRGVDIASMVICVLILGFFIVFFTLNRYIIQDNKLIKHSIIKTIVPVEKMLMIRVDNITGMTVLYYADENSPNDGISFVILSVGKKEEALIEDLRRLNKYISVDTIVNKE